ncbi:NAD(P)-binding protein [Cryphonectria parasitica EP155]|uniref:NAD(P)-binding protein n=1 Tax=Cryphonectria parasitica (strain ATCC 38755 / EP155) TaxID=660469 RepID=A0A9P4YAT9_CRYP1|nr:NAD(P)-binding protein [Cryphonectria parasitica EP155]KAF3769467.1 NAD(P)-binding protein [Cryphonectria parasitica EP155]
MADNAWPKTMRAWTFDGATPSLAKALHLEEQAAPPPKSLFSPQAILVEVLYMAVNPADYKVASLGILARTLMSPPAHPGMDYSGRVVVAGEAAAADYRPGQLVFGRIEPNKYGTLGQYIIVKNGDGLARVPSGLENKMAEMAAVGTCGLTAVQTIRPYLPKEEGKDGKKSAPKVFINGGSGGTGTYGIQVAKALGCHVTVSCSGSSAQLCQELGADEVIDYKTQDISAVLKAKGQQPEFSVVVDNVGITPSEQQDLYIAANSFLRPDGTFVHVGGGVSMGQVKSAMKRTLVPGFLGGGKRQFKMILTQQSHADLETIAGWMEAGKVKSVMDEVFTFENAPKAYEKLETGRAKGKIVVQVGGS